MTYAYPEATLEQRVRAGRDWLDASMPGWRDRVSIMDLDMSNGCYCVLGQLFEVEARQSGRIMPENHPGAGRGLGFMWAARGNRVLSTQQARDYGFDFSLSPSFASRARTDPVKEFRELQKLWVKVIKGEEI